MSIMARFQFFWDHCWGQHPWLQRPHVLNDLIDLSEVMEDMPLVLPWLLDDKDQGIPRAVSLDDVPFG